MFNRKLALEEESAVFILVNFADVVLTACTFRYGGWETNLLARWIIDRFGIMGLSFYKFGLVTFVIIACQFIHATHPKTARAVLVAGSVAYGILVLFETVQLFTHAFSLL